MVFSNKFARQIGLEEHLHLVWSLRVPQNLAGSVLPFSVNNIEQLKKIVANNELVAVKMEVQRAVPPKKGFLEEVKSLVENGIVLIFDECTSGFRETFGGLHLNITLIQIWQFLAKL